MRRLRPPASTQPSAFMMVMRSLFGLRNTSPKFVILSVTEGGAKDLLYLSFNIGAKRRSTNLPILRTSSSCAQQFKHANHRLNPAIKIRDVELLVGRVQVIVRQTEAHNHRGNIQMPLDVSTDGDRSAAAHKYRLLAEDLAHSILRRRHIR